MAFILFAERLKNDIIEEISNTTALDERIRDVVGNLLVAGNEISITVNDFSDIITIAVAERSETIMLVCSDETTELTAGGGKVTFRMPYSLKLTEVRASLSSAATGSSVVVDINENLLSILSTKLSIDAGEKTSVTAAVPAVIADTTLLNNSEITIDLDQVGSGFGGAGLKVYLTGTRV